MLNYEFQIEQENRVTEAINALSESVNQPKPPTEQYSGGWFDGYIGERPRYPEDWEYWSGYSLGNREYWCQPKGIELGN